MNCSFCHAGCRKRVVKNEIFHMKIGQNLKFLDTWELYTSKESLEHVQYKFKKKKYDFLKKNWFLEIFDFLFQRGDPLISKLSKRKFPFFKNFKNNIEK